MNEQKVISKDLQKFIERFQPNKFKIISSGIEVRGMMNIHQAIELARKVIEKFKLDLVIRHDADMVGYGGFEVKSL
ncbi:hypothetical protein QWY86_18470 [Pedobacter aquatilis]|uniref:hypothetical protein n=1 Tax=Pedobacter aquatilis TaxID=351343 RepID=UPI0025B501B8|nr:hypothetical protein [Pedobacter aquatilis]MDN3588673.1 hypothetical protein [Pedobacter aquatilis]